MTLFNKAELTAEQKLQRCLVQLVCHEHYNAYAGLFMIGDRTIHDDVPTAYTDGKNEKYGVNFVQSLSEPELRFVVMHEMMHKLYRHLTTWVSLWKIDSQLANMACDYVINIKLVDESPNMANGEPFLKMPKVGLFDKKYRGWNAKQVFDSLLKEGKGKGKGDSLDEHGWEAAQQLSDEEQQTLEREIDSAVRQAVLMANKRAGKDSLSNEQLFGELLKPKRDWRKELKEFVKLTCRGTDRSTWSRPNRRYLGYGMYMPTGISDRLKDVAIFMDMSGSIEKERDVFMGESLGIFDKLKPEQLHLGYWDTEITQYETYTTRQLKDIAKLTKPKGGGGTDPQCIPVFLKEQKIKPSCVIVFTDGYVGSWGTREQWMGIKVLWCVVGNRSAAPTVGKCVHVEL